MGLKTIQNFIAEDEQDPHVAHDVKPPAVQEHGTEYRHPGVLWLCPKPDRDQSPSIDKTVESGRTNAQLVIESYGIEDDDQPVYDREFG